MTSQEAQQAFQKIMEDCEKLLAEEKEIAKKLKREKLQFKKRASLYQQASSSKSQWKTAGLAVLATTNAINNMTLKQTLNQDTQREESSMTSVEADLNYSHDVNQSHDDSVSHRLPCDFHNYLSNGNESMNNQLVGPKVK